MDNPEVDEEPITSTAKGSRSTYARIRTSFVAKFGSLLSGKNEEGNEGTVEDRRKSRRKTVAPKAPEVDSADLQEIRTLIEEGKQPDSRRGALLGIFKMSLRENLLEALISEGALDVLAVGLNQEAKGSAARRAAMQAVRNLAAHTPNHQIMLDSIVPTVARVLAEEAPGSGPREAALEALANLSGNSKIRSKLAGVENVVTAVMTAAKSEPQGTPGRESALVILERLSQASPPQTNSNSSSVVSPRASSKGAAARPVSQDKLEEEEEDDAFDVQAVIDACLDSASKEPKGSSARVVAMRTLRNFAESRYRGKVAATPGLFETALQVARDDGPGSETRAIVFSLFSALSNDRTNGELLIKTATLVDTIIAAVRDEAPKSATREFAMFTVANLCQDPKNHPTFMKGSGEGLVNVCVRASTQEAPGSGGRAAALEVCAALARSPQNQEGLFKSAGLVALAVESAHAEKSERVKKAGLDVIASLALESETYRSAIYKMKHASDAVTKAACDSSHSELQASGLAALRSLCRSSEIRSNLRKATLEKVLEALKNSRTGSKIKYEAISCLEEGLFDKWSDAKLTYELIEACAYALKQEAAGSDIKTKVCSILTVACEHNHEKVVMQSGVCATLLTAIREFVEVETQNRGAKTNELYSRASLRRTPVSKHSVGTPEQLCTDCTLALKLLAALVRRGAIPESTVGGCHSLITLSQELEAEGKNKLDSDSLVLASIIAIRAIPSNCANASIAKDIGGVLSRLAIPRFVPLLSSADKAAGNLEEDVLEAVFVLSCFQNCVESGFETVAEPIAQRLCQLSDEGEKPRTQQLLCGILLNCLFVQSLADPLKVAAFRSDLDQALLRIGNRGSEEFSFAPAARVAQAVTSGFKIIQTTQSSTLSPQAAKQKKITILTAHDGLLLAKKVDETTKKMKGCTSKIEEAEWLSDKASWEKIALKQRKGHLDSVIQNIRSSNAVVVCSSKGAEGDPVIRMLAEFASACGIPTVVCTGVETTSTMCFGSWLETFKANHEFMEANELLKWKPIN